MITKVFRNLFVIYSYFTVFMAGSVGAGDTKAEHAMHVYFIATATSGVAWFLTSKFSMRVKVKVIRKLVVKP